MSNCETKVVSQRAQKLEGFSQLICIKQRRQVGEHPRDLDATGALQGFEAFDLLCRRLLQPAIENKRIFYRPSKGAVAVAVGVFVGQAESFIQKPSV